MTRSDVASSTSTSGQCARGCAALTPTSYSTAIASVWSSMERLCGAHTLRWRRCIRNGAATASSGGAISQRDRARAIPHGSTVESEWLVSPFHPLIDRARAHEHNPSMRRHLREGPDLRDFPVLVEFHGEGATDYVAYLFELGGDRSQETWASIRSRRIRRAASATMTRRSCKRLCRRWR